MAIFSGGTLKASTRWLVDGAPGKVGLAIVAMLGLPVGATAQEFASYLPTAEVIHGDVMTPVASPEFAALTETLAAAVEENRLWFIAHVALAGAGPLPYHPNLGLTPEEYERYLSLAASGGISLERVASIEMTLARSEDGAVTFVVDPTVVPLHMVSIAGDGAIVTTPFGELIRLSDVDQVNPDGPTGRWSGPRWRYEGFQDGVAWNVQFAIGRRDDFGDGIITYTVQSTASARYDLIILFPL